MMNKSMIGCDILFNNSVGILNEYPEPGMMATIIGLEKDSEFEGVYIITISYDKYDHMNKSLEKKKIFDHVNKEYLTHREAGLYESEESFYVNEEGMVFDLVPDNVFFPFYATGADYTLN